MFGVEENQFPSEGFHFLEWVELFAVLVQVDQLVSKQKLFYKIVFAHFYYDYRYFVYDGDDEILYGDGHVYVFSFQKMLHQHHDFFYSH